MYEVIRTAFGAFEQITLINKSNGNGISVVPEAKGTLTEILFNQQNVLLPFTSFEDLEENTASKHALLFPFPNRLEQGTYHHLGMDYKFPLNDSAGPNALHGIVDEVHFDILKIETNPTDAYIQLSYFNEGNHPAYPFAFLVDVKYSISDENGFRLDLKLTNESNQAIPAGFGWHPYFLIQDTINTCKLSMPKAAIVEVNNNFIPTGKLFDYTYFEKARIIGKTVLDNAFKLEAPSGLQVVNLSNDLVSLKYWQESGPQKFNFLQIFTPDSRDSIAIEPMTCNINAFNNKDGLVILEPEACVSASCGVEVDWSLDH